MKSFLFSLLFFVTFYLNAQDVVKSYESVTIIKPREIGLNGGTRAAIGGKSRESIKIDLPENTVKWYYSFSTSAGESGIKNLNLAAQLAATLATKSSPVGVVMSATGITNKVLKTIEVPQGSSSVDIYVCDKTNIDKFNEKADNWSGTYSYIIEGTVENTKQAVVQINDVTKGTWYLGLKNPSSLDAVNITIEVVAIVEKETIIEKTQTQEKAELYGGLGWKQFESDNYEKCIEYCNKANEYYELGWVNANKGLAQLLLGKESEAIDTYVNAITLIKSQNNPEYVIKEVVTDLQNAIDKKGNVPSANDIIEIIKLEFDLESSHSETRSNNFNSAEIVFQKTVYDFGNVSIGGNGTCKFYFTNEGDQTLVVNSVNSNCKCISANPSSNYIEPNATEYVQVTYDTNRMGPIDKEIEVNTNAGAIVLRIKGQVK